ncbi:RNA methyltransferase [Prosthecochloris sp. N3]|uniref:RNA methyltransferase n=1 Tax=Prosthecochloris ethylica TaxID=2743976 RepID=A0ABR9XNQ1_9CHLB|nr:RNA methyltransferase [Prosthecochloris ethylica]MBF0585742.1 RNA methyltransferase [Prosthecochloris ethylica]MBF0635652.1 RNA methyltransferase [Prosthecochloris ethylica]MEC9486556.1 RNA methyltransferase [Prosthecochloris sp.]NUK46951.1 RNA methyltransferase [Prosthecochloris ethylica]
MSRPAYPSASREQIRRAARLHRKKYREEERCFLAEGLRTVTELLDRLPHRDSLVTLFVLPELLDDLIHKAWYRDRIVLITPEESRKLAGTMTAQGVVGVFRMPREAWTPAPGGQSSLVLALDDIQDPGNAGTMMRTAAWFGADALVCGRGTVDLFNPKCVRSSAGSLYGPAVFSADDLETSLRDLQQQGYAIAAASPEGADIHTLAPWPSRVVLVIGNEANGISREILQMADLRISIRPGAGGGGVESLNAAVSAAVLMYEFSRQHHADPES